MREYVIDLESFVVVAQNEDEAYEKAIHVINEKDIGIVQIIDVGEYDDSYE
jgi:hypothetical protein